MVIIADAVAFNFDAILFSCTIVQQLQLLVDNLWKFLAINPQRMASREMEFSGNANGDEKSERGKSSREHPSRE